jgi:hypothetical protein
MVIIRPNLRRMRYMRDSPSTDSAAETRDGGIVWRKWWERVIFAGLGAAIVLGLLLAWHYGH